MCKKIKMYLLFTALTVSPSGNIYVKDFFHILYNSYFSKYSFKKIVNILQRNILCKYRNILYVYSKTWLTIDEIQGIQILKTRKRTVSSFLHNSYSIIVTLLL